jgi:hypothetical protein
MPWKHLLLLALPLLSQPGPGVRDRTIDAAEKNQTIDAILSVLNKRYLFPEVARKMDDAVRERQKRHEYDAVTSGRDFAKVLTEHLQAVSNDKHLQVHHSFDAIPDGPQSPPPDPREEFEEARRRVARNNFGFERVERLSGNVGYLDLRSFSGLEFAAETAIAAMNFLANSDALIIDLRNNGGGLPNMVLFLSSYLLDGVTHVGDRYNRRSGSPSQQFTYQQLTFPYVPGKKFAGKPVYVLTSRRTFSAAEGFTYNLKILKRATVVGETTGGGAHDGPVVRIGPHFRALIPSGRTIHPISKTNWEGTGVAPDVSVSQEMALKMAHLLAVKKLRESEKDQRLASQLSDLIKTLEKEVEAQKK